MSDDEGWIKHDGGPCPVALDSKPGVKFKDGLTNRPGRVSATVWTWHDDSWRHLGPERNHIIAYKPEASDDR